MREWNCQTQIWLSERENKLTNARIKKKNTTENWFSMSLYKLVIIQISVSVFPLKFVQPFLIGKHISSELVERVLRTI